MHVSLPLIAALLIGTGASDDAAKEMDRLKVPAKLIPDKSQPLFLLRAEGVQIYKGMDKAGKLQWVLDAPGAVLLDYAIGAKVGTHTKGPVWEATDGSKLHGKLLAKEPAPNPQAVDWLLLEAKGDGGKGRFGSVTHIARIDTWSGRPPSAPPDKVGAVVEVRYQATYVYFGSR